MNDKQSKRETFAGLTEENERLHSDLQKAKTDNDQLRRDLGLLKKQLSRKISLDDDRLQQMEMEELWEKLTRLEEEKLSLTKTISELATSKETLSKEVEELLAKNQSLEKKLTSSKGQLAHCEEELNESKDLNVFLQDQIDEIKMQLKKEICEAHDELRALYEEFRSSHASSDSVEIDDLEPSSDFKPGCLTTFVKNFRDVLEEMVRDNSTRTTNLRQQLCKAHEKIDSLEEKLVAVNSEAKKREEEVASLKENLNEKDREIEHIKEQRNKLAKGECESQLAYDIMYNEAVQEKQNAVEREKSIAKELKQSKEDREELDHQLKEAIEQKIRLSKQLEDWQFDMASLIDDQVQKQMKSAAKEHDDNARRRRMSAFARTTRWHWNSGNNRRQNML